MAKNKPMPVEEALQVILAAYPDNPLRDLLQAAVQGVLELEMTEHLGARPYERNDERQGYRNGHRARVLTTAVGDLTLLVPQDRDGTFSTVIFERYQRSDKAFVLALMEMYVKGVSTRKVAAITEELCGKSFSSQQVSRLASMLDARISEWRSRPLSGKDRHYPYLIVDATYQKVRKGGRVVSQAVLVVLGVNERGKREILDVEVADTENKATWSDLFKRLKKRGLSGVLLVTSDDHEGIKAAVARHFQGASWQRCQFHFMQNLMSYATKGQRALLKSDLRAIFDSPDSDTAWVRINDVLANWRNLNGKVAQRIEEEIEETTSVLDFPGPHRKRTRTTNALERLNQEIRRRTRVARIFPNEASALRLTAAIAMEQSDEWETGRQYLDVGLLDNWTFQGAQHWPPAQPEESSERNWPFDEPAEPARDLSLVKGPKS
jgi:transposase-like protein